MIDDAPRALNLAAMACGPGGGLGCPTEATARNLAYRGVDDVKALLAGAVLPENPDD